MRSELSTLRWLRAPFSGRLLMPPKSTRGGTLFTRIASPSATLSSSPQARNAFAGRFSTLGSELVCVLAPSNHRRMKKRATVNGPSQPKRDEPSTHRGRAMSVAPISKGAPPVQPKPPSREPKPAGTPGESMPIDVGKKLKLKVVDNHLLWLEIPLPGIDDPLHSDLQICL